MGCFRHCSNKWKVKVESGMAAGEFASLEPCHGFGKDRYDFTSQ
jgi:hypothetical protein